MQFAIQQCRFILHLLRGLVTIATRFPRASPEVKQKLTRAWSIKMLRLCGVRLVVHEHGETLQRGAMVVSNHVSWTDIYVIDAWRPTPFVSKAEIRQYPMVGWMAEQIGTVFIQREKRSDAMRIMQQLADRLTSGQLICVFPEGTTSDGTGLLPFHTNLFQASYLAKCPVQPICLMYEGADGRQSMDVPFIGDMSLMDSLKAVMGAARPLTAHLYICPPIPPGGDRRQVAAQAQQMIDAALRTMQASVGAPAAAAGATGPIGPDSAPGEGGIEGATAP